MVSGQNSIRQINGSVIQSNNLSGEINQNENIREMTFASNISGLISNTNMSGEIDKSNCLSGESGKVIIPKDKELVFKNYQQFPTIGAADLLYISTDDNSIYRFNEDTLTYVCVGRDYKEIDTIQSVL